MRVPVQKSTAKDIVDDEILDTVDLESARGSPTLNALSNQPGNDDSTSPKPEPTCLELARHNALATGYSILENSGIIWIYDSCVYGEYPPYVIATVLSLLKALQAVGTNVFGLQQTFKQYHINNKNTVIGLVTAAVICNIIATLLTRFVSNFRSLTKPKFYLTHEPIDKLYYINQLQGKLILHQELYFFAPGSTSAESSITLWKCWEDGSLTQSPLDKNGTKIIKDLFSALSSRNEYSSVSLTQAQYKQFCIAKRKKEDYGQWSYFVWSAYWFLIIPCAATSIFSSMVAYLAANTLETNIGMPKIMRLGFSTSIVSGNFSSYCTFNLTGMSEEVKKICKNLSQQKMSILDEIYKKPGETLVNLPLSFVQLCVTLPENIYRNPIETATLFFTIFGTCANIGFAYFSMTNLFNMPEFQEVDDRVKAAFIYANMYGALFSSTLNFSAKTYDLIKKCDLSTVEWPTTLCTLISAIINTNTILSGCILADTFCNTLGAYLGIQNIIQSTITSHDATLQSAYFAIGLIMCASYVFLTFGMARNGAEKAIQWSSSCSQSQKTEIEEDTIHTALLDSNSNSSESLTANNHYPLFANKRSTSKAAETYSPINSMGSE